MIRSLSFTETQEVLKKSLAIRYPDVSWELSKGEWYSLPASPKFSPSPSVTLTPLSLVWEDGPSITELQSSYLEVYTQCHPYRPYGMYNMVYMVSSSGDISPWKMVVSDDWLRRLPLSMRSMLSFKLFTKKVICKLQRRELVIPCCGGISFSRSVSEENIRRYLQGEVLGYMGFSRRDYRIDIEKRKAYFTNGAEFSFSDLLPHVIQDISF